MRAILAAALAALVCGCASSGTRIDPAALSELRPAHTTYDEMVQRFGRPNFTSTNWDGTRTAVYAWSAGRSDAAMALPALGAAVAGGGAGARSITLHFDERGVLQALRSSRAETPATGPAGPGLASANESRQPHGVDAGPPAAAANSSPPRPDAPRAPGGPAAPADPDALPWWLPSRNFDPRN